MADTGEIDQNTIQLVNDYNSLVEEAQANRDQADIASEIINDISDLLNFGRY